MSKMIDEIIKEITGLSTHEGQRVIELNTLKSLEKLNKQLGELNKTIKKSNKQNSALEKSNYRLQVMIFILAFIATGLTVVSSSQTILKIWTESLPWLKLSDSWILVISFFILDFFIFIFTKIVARLFSEKKNK